VRWIGREQARPEALPDQAALSIAPIRVEAVANDAAAVAHRVGHHRDQADGHLGKST